jgi:hypothetical protein
MQPTGTPALRGREDVSPTSRTAQVTQEEEGIALYPWSPLIPCRGTGQAHSTSADEPAGCLPVCKVKHPRSYGMAAREGVPLAFRRERANLCNAAKRFAACCFLGRFLPKLGGTSGCRHFFRRKCRGIGREAASAIRGFRPGKAG